MYENEFNGALQAIAESVDEANFDAIVEGASALIEEYGLSMDEAVSASAAALYTEDMIDETSYAVTAAVMDEFANSMPASWNDALTVIAESVDEETFDQLMTEAVNGMIDSINEAGKVSQAATSAKNAALRATGVPDVVHGVSMLKSMKGDPNQKEVIYTRNAKGKTSKTTRGATNTKAAAGQIGKGLAKGLGTLAVSAAGGRLAYNAAKGDALKDVKALKAAAAKKLESAKEAAKELPDKASAIADKVKEKVSPKNESTTMTLADLRALAESFQAPEEQ